MNKLKHHNFWCANKTLKWFPTDTQELYDQNLKDPIQKQQLDEHGWIDADITYVNNSRGFRTSEFDPSKNFLALGCSITYGIGLPQHCVWPELLSDLVDTPVFNLGVAGGSLDTCYRAAKHYVPLLKPKFVVMLQPENSRMEIFLENWPHIYLPNRPDDYNFANNDWIKHWYTNEQNSNTLMQKNIDAIAWVCKQNQVDFYLMDQDLAYNYNGPQLDLARDLQHPGKKFHKNLAKLFFEKIQNKNTYE
jgi:hypothetical protein